MGTSHWQILNVKLLKSKVNQIPSSSKASDAGNEFFDPVFFSGDGGAEEEVSNQDFFFGVDAWEGRAAARQMLVNEIAKSPEEMRMNTHRLVWTWKEPSLQLSQKKTFFCLKPFQWLPRIAEIPL